MSSISSRSHSFSTVTPALPWNSASHSGARGKLVAPLTVVAHQHDASTAPAHVLDDRFRPSV